MGEEAARAQAQAPGQQAQGLAAGLMPRRGRRAVLAVLLASLGAVGLGLLYLATHPRRAPLRS
ncbi:Protein of unknown function [Gryllus bimaculatus]|nr:Protein of unknown function [Gryllus bimaculatus]